MVAVNKGFKINVQRKGTNANCVNTVADEAPKYVFSGFGNLPYKKSLLGTTGKGGRDSGLQI